MPFGCSKCKKVTCLREEKGEREGGEERRERREGVLLREGLVFTGSEEFSTDIQILLVV